MHLLLALIISVGFFWGNTAEAQVPSQDEKLLRVDLSQYTPGMIPGGIGEPVKAARTVADAWEQLHPNCKVKYQLMVNTGTTEGEWLKTQLIGKIAPEIVTMNTEVAWQAIDKDWFVPLDEILQRPNPYIPGNEHWLDSFSNKALTNSKRAPNGKLYCITLDTVETGLYYNMTLLKKLGIDRKPETWEEMIEAFKIIQNANTTPMTAQSNIASDWGQDIIFEMIYHEIMPLLDVNPSAADVKDYQEYFFDPPEGGFLFTKGFFSSRDPRWREMHRILKEWRNYWAKELKFTDPMRLFLTGRLAVLWDGSWTIRRVAKDPYINFEWDIGYIPAITKETSHYASGTPATLIGGAAMQVHITNSAVYNHSLEECVDFLMYLSAPQNIEKIAGEALLFMPNVNGAKMDPRLQPFAEIIKRKSCAIQWMEAMDPEYKKVWRRWLDYYLEDGFGLDEYLRILDENFAAWVKSHENDSAWDFTAMEKVWQSRQETLLRELNPAP
ncbi:MAG TPA: ABC transporter substrate-binding protein [Candidatus Hydrogenedentes bacterium]|mgnify:CR=1 FL=1|nr:ABC transporter substrate-binding protein [Candidatus Hydrogenedentota bacterium]